MLLTPPVAEAGNGKTPTLYMRLLRAVPEKYHDGSHMCKYVTFYAGG